MAKKIKFGTDGWRAIIADDFTTEGVARVSEGLAKYLNSKSQDNKVVIGHDCRFGGKLFVDVAARVLAANGIHVTMADNHFVSTPMVSFATLQLQAQQGVIITASHNPPSYNGYKLKSEFGGPSSPEVISAVEDLIPDEIVMPEKSVDDFVADGLIEFHDLEGMYLDYMNEKFDIETLDISPKNLAYDAMYGAGQNVIRKLFGSAELVRCEYNPSFMGQAPEPLAKNLIPLRNHIMANGMIDLGFATDGDADRIGMYDGDGHFIDAHHIILLLIHYLAHYQEMSGKVVIAFSVTDKVKKLCDHYGLTCEVTKIGFKYIAEIMVKEDVLVGGEESGGIAVKGHIPERDGIYDGILLYDFIVRTGKTINELIEEVYDIVGPFVYTRDDLHLSEEKKQSIISNCEEGEYTQFGPYKIVRTETIDGYKYFMENGEWLMIRPSGTEPVLRVYAEAATTEEVQELISSAKETILA